ncbi:NUP35 [Lepeophtheirus salmonis]|nr:NUP35 [Lepeophtheirus salmonis]CAF3030950.1 NUP35 [Lepeophtheirus salmonis]
MQAQKALSKNGKVMGGSIMIGVRPGGQIEDQEASVFNHPSENQPPNSSMLNSSKLETSVLNRSTIRPLTQAYKVSQTEHEVLADSNTPSKNNGFVNKAMEYIFGW